jgi:glycerate 2-kinase
MVQVQNRRQLIENGTTPQLRQARSFAIKSLECALNAADPKQLIHSKIKLKNSYLTVNGGDSFSLERFKNIYVVGGGKASALMAQALEEVLGKHITAGLVNVPYGAKLETKIVELNEASHPIPDQAGVEGTFRIMDIVDQAKGDELVICLISGGGSSLMPLPRAGILLQDIRTLTDTLLKSGASIIEINIVRKHLSAFKGGWLAKKAYPATLINLLLSDVIGDSIESIASGPSAPDSSTFCDAQKVLEKYNLWQTTSSSIRKVLSEGVKGLLEETPKPKDPAFANVHNVIIGNNRTATQAAAEYLKAEGLKTIHFDDPLDGEASHIGKALAKFAGKVSAYDFSLPKPIAVVAGGETTVKVKGDGIGGRNQELELSAALHLADSETCVIASLSTDGVDGPTDAAGAIIDGYTLKRAAQFGLDPAKSLEHNDSYSFFSRLSDLVVTKPTGTNVNDISVIIVL